MRSADKTITILELPPDPSGTPPGIGHLRSPITADVFARHCKYQGIRSKKTLLWDIWGIPIAREGERTKRPCSDIADEYIASWKNARNHLDLLKEEEEEITSTYPAAKEGAYAAFERLVSHQKTIVKKSPSWYCASCATEVMAQETKKPKCPSCDNGILGWRFRPAVFLSVKEHSAKLAESIAALRWPTDLKNSFGNFFRDREGLDIDFDFGGHVFPAFWPENENIPANIQSLEISPSHPYVEIYQHAFTVHWLDIEANILNKRGKRFPLEISAHTSLQAAPVTVILNTDLDLQGTYGSGMRIVATHLSPFTVGEAEDLKRVKRSKLQDLRISSERSWGLEIESSSSWNISRKTRLHPLFVLACFFNGYGGPEAGHDITLGAADHAQTPLLYAKCIGFILNTLSSSSSECIAEPFPQIIRHGIIVGIDGKKMSRLHDNVVDAMQTLAGSGSDVTRLAMMAMGPVDSRLRWNANILRSMQNFVTDLERWAKNPTAGTDSRLFLEEALNSVEHDLDCQKYHIAVRKLRKIFQSVIRPTVIRKEDLPSLEKYFRLLEIFAPAIAGTLSDQWKHRFALQNRSSTGNIFAKTETKTL